MVSRSWQDWNAERERVLDGPPSLNRKQVTAMVSVSRETSTQTRTRLRAVMANSEIVVLDGAWSFVETPVDEPPPLG